MGNTYIQQVKQGPKSDEAANIMSVDQNHESHNESHNESDKAEVAPSLQLTWHICPVAITCIQIARSVP